MCMLLGRWASLPRRAWRTTHVRGRGRVGQGRGGLDRVGLRLCRGACDSSQAGLRVLRRHLPSCSLSLLTLPCVCPVPCSRDLPLWSRQPAAEDGRDQRHAQLACCPSHACCCCCCCQPQPLTCCCCQPQPHACCRCCQPQPLTCCCCQPQPQPVSTVCLPQRRQQPLHPPVGGQWRAGRLFGGVHPDQRHRQQLQPDVAVGARGLQPWGERQRSEAAAACA